MTAASDVIGIEDVFDARIASGGRTASARRKIASFTSASSTTASIEEIRGDDVVDGRHAGEDVLGGRAALLGELREAPLHRRERPLGGAGKLVVERHAPTGSRDDLRDPAAHLARADDQDVLELHGARLR